MDEQTPTNSENLATPTPPTTTSNEPSSAVSNSEQSSVTTNNSNSEGRTLWMGAIQASWDEAYIRSTLFNNNEELVNVKLMRNPASNMPAGYAFLEFSTHDAAKAVLDTYNGLQIQGTNVYYRLNWGAGGRSKPGGAQEYSLFVGDLAPEVTDLMLQEAFSSKFSACSNAKVVTDAQTGGSKGYGFVRFSDKAQSEEALRQMNGATIGSRIIRVSAATQKRQDRMGYGGLPQPPPAASPYGMDMQGRGGMNGGYRHMNAMHPAAAAQGQYGMPPTANMAVMGGAGGEEHDDGSGAFPGMSPMQQQSQPMTENTTVFVGNLDPSVTESQLEDHFKAFGTIKQIKIPPNRGCGFVKFETREAAEKALNVMHGSVLSGLRLRLDWGKANASRMGQGMGHDSSMMGYSQYQQHQYYQMQWQAQQAQAQAAYYYQIPARQMYMVPPQHVHPNMRQPHSGPYQQQAQAQQQQQQPQQPMYQQQPPHHGGGEAPQPPASGEGGSSSNNNART